MFVCNVGYMDGEIKWWKNEYRNLYIDLFITSNPEPWKLKIVESMVEGGLDTYFDAGDAGSWEDYTPEEAFKEDMHCWQE